MRVLLFLVLVSMSLQGCAREEGNSAPSQQASRGVLPTDQGESAADLQMTAEIRRRIVDLSEISTSARNIKIITRDGRVTLRGPVASEQEREMVERIARDVAGAEQVATEITVTP
jgi:hyperosmotically inducible protein